MSDLIIRDFNGHQIPQRADGYLNATAMCKANGKEWSNYRQNAATEEFVEALSGSLGIPRDLLVVTVTKGPNAQRGTFVHPHIGYNLGQWLSPAFAVQVSQWIDDIRSKGYATAPGVEIDHELAERTNGITRMLAKKVTAQEKAIARVLEILEARGAGIPVEVPKGTTLVRQHARRVSVEREKALHLSTLIERLERVLVSDAPPMIPPPDMDRHMIYRAGIALVLVDAADWRLGRGEKAFVLHDGRMTAAIMHGVGNQDGSLWSKDRTGWAFVHEFPGIAEPSLCQVKVLGRLIKTVADPNYGRAA